MLSHDHHLLWKVAHLKQISMSSAGIFLYNAYERQIFLSRPSGSLAELKSLPLHCQIISMVTSNDFRSVVSNRIWQRGAAFTFAFFFSFTKYFQPFMQVGFTSSSLLSSVRDIYQTYQPNVIGPSPVLLVLVVQGLVAYIYSCQGSL